ncbi:hypothetical protein [Sutcliffiella deserti]|uniref:hypothetical protein n=1 Tax=Sutcliffiella deserti TaxID=2875501 RepID=UPI001CBFAF9D|nr:hypothetical protein [Sutcliffiella deserti]
MLDKKLLEELEEYIQAHLFLETYESTFKMAEPIYEKEQIPYDLDDYLKKNRTLTLQELLFSYIDDKGLKDADVYKKAGMDRKHFSKIRTNPSYKPRKQTVLSLAFALELKAEDVDELLGAAGFSLSNSDTFDLVVQFFLEREIYNLQQINETLDYLSLKPLGGGLN